jgi:DNA polymerase III subunit epsilon
MPRPDPHAEYVVFDLETTGLSPEKDAIVEIGALKIRGGVVREHERFESLVRPQRPDGSVMPIPWRVQQIHGIGDQMVARAPVMAEVLPHFLDFVGDAAVVAHNISFDGGFMRAATRRCGLLWRPASEHCTVQLSRKAFPRERAHNLDVLAQRLNLEFERGGRHRSFGDVQVTAQAFVRLMAMLSAEPVR